MGGESTGCVEEQCIEVSESELRGGGHRTNGLHRHGGEASVGEGAEEYQGECLGTLLRDIDGS